MRETKFRGNRVGNGKWVYGVPLYSVVGAKVIIDTIQSYEDLRFYTVIPETVGQFTGLHDKNGKEIYEGDIVIHKGKYHDVIGQITFGKASMFTPDGGHQGFYTKWLNDGSNRWEDWWRNDLNYWIDKIEIIGNIHTNPELLKEVSDEA